MPNKRTGKGVNVFLRVPPFLLGIEYFWTLLKNKTGLVYFQAKIYFKNKMAHITNSVDRRVSSLVS